MARRTIVRPPDVYDPDYMSYLVDQLEYITGLTVQKGEQFYINAGDGSEIVLTSANGTKYKIVVNNDGSLTTTTVA